MTAPDLPNKAKSEAVRAIIADVLSCKLPEADAEVSMVHLPNWDSMAHVSIVVALETRFDVEATIGLLEAQSLDELLAELQRL